MDKLNYDLRFYISPSLLESVDGLASTESPSVQVVRPLLESNQENQKHKGMRILLSWLAGGTLEGTALHDKLLMTVIRFVSGCKDHNVGKLVHLYWEGLLTNTDDSGGEGRSEILLISQIVRNELQSPNEYVRGACLRNLSKICTTQILTSVQECIVENLSHPFSYVRRSAVMCICALARKFGPTILDSTSELEIMALTELDVGTQRAAMLALLEINPVRAAEIFLTSDQEIRNLSDICLLTIIEVIRKVFREIYQVFPPTNDSLKLAECINKEVLAQRLECLIDMGSNAVALEASTTLLNITDFAPGACRLASAALVKVVNNQKDINVRLAIIDVFLDIRRRCQAVFEDYAVDILRMISTPSYELRQNILDCCLPAVTKRSLKNTITALKSELVVSMHEKAEENQKQLIRSLRRLCSKFPEAADSFIEILLDLLTEGESKASSEVALLMREIILFIPRMRPKILAQFIDGLGEIVGAKALRMVVWIFGEFCDSEKTRIAIIDALYAALSPFPLPNPEHEDPPLTNDGAITGPGLDDNEIPAANEPKVKVSVRTIILPDGSYGTESVAENFGAGQDLETVKVSGLRLAVTGRSSTLLIAMIGVTLAKLGVKKFPDTASSSEASQRTSMNKTLLILSSLIKYYSACHLFGTKSALVLRLKQCLRCIVHMDKLGKRVAVSQFDNEPELKKVVEIEREAVNQEELNVVMANEDAWLRVMGASDDMFEKEQLALASSGLDDVINFGVISGSETNNSIVHASCGGSTSSELCSPLVDFTDSLEHAVKGKRKTDESAGLTMALLRSSKAVPLSGYSDPVYVEVVMQINHLNLIVEILLVNQTDETLQDVCVALGTHGESKILEKPQGVTLAPGAEATVYATIRLSSTEAGVIFGYCSFERRSSIDKEYSNLNELQIDLLDCIQRAWIGSLTFRTMWAEFEWENKLSVQLPTDDALGFIVLLLRQTKMTIVGLHGESFTAKKLAELRNGDESSVMLTDDSDAAETERYIKIVLENSQLQKMLNSRVVTLNFCAKSIFGEDALMNLSLERAHGQPMTGSVRIRSRTQGIALSLGDRIAQTQRLFASTSTNAPADTLLGSNTDAVLAF